MLIDDAEPMARTSESEEDRQPDLTGTARHLNSGAIHLLRGLRAVDREAGLTPARLSALSVIVFGGPCTLGRLAAAEGVASPTMTRIVDGLCELGLARREPHPDNARMALISATTEGETLMRAAVERRFKRIVAAMSALPETDRILLQEAAPALHRLAHVLRGWDPPA